MPVQCPSCNAQIPDNSPNCPMCGAVSPVQAQPIQDGGAHANPYAASADPLQAGAPMQPMHQMPPGHQGDTTGGVIPYKNPKALIAYYLGIFSGLPLIGLPIGIAAFVLGVLGLRDRKRNPVIKGSAHAWIGIGCGGIFTLLWLVLLIGIIVAAANA